MASCSVSIQPLQDILTEAGGDMAEQGHGQISKVTYKCFVEDAPDHRYHLTFHPASIALLEHCPKNFLINQINLYTTQQYLLCSTEMRSLKTGQRQPVNICM